MARIEAEWDTPGQFAVKTARVTEFAILLSEKIARRDAPVKVTIDGGSEMSLAWPKGDKLVFRKADGAWVAAGAD